MRKIRLSTRWRPSAVTDSKISHVTHAICLQLIAKFLYSRQQGLDRKFPRVCISGSWEIERIFYILYNNILKSDSTVNRLIFIKFFIFKEFDFFQHLIFFFFFWSFKWNSWKKFLLIFFLFFFSNVFLKWILSFDRKFFYLPHFNIFSIFFRLRSLL